MISIITPHADWPKGYDAADALMAGWSTEQAEALINSASPFSTGPKASKAKKAGSQKLDLAAFVDEIVKFQTENAEPYISVFDGIRMNHCQVRDQRARNYITLELERISGGISSSRMVEDVLRSIEAHCSRAPVHQTFRRVAYADGAIYLDLHDDLGRVVQVTCDGWQVITNPPVRFLRSGTSISLPVPQEGAMIEELRAFIPGDDDTFILSVAWLLGGLMHKGPFPLLVLSGEQGSGKSLRSRLLRSVIDPSNVPIRSASKDERDLLIAAINGWIIVYDNLSTVQIWLSDSLCRLAMGTAVGVRKNYTDSEETILAAARPVIINGIGDLAERADLADRCISIHLPRIKETERRTEKDIWSDFEKAHPAILGALLDAAVTGLRRLDEVRLDRYPRMADFCHFIEMCAPALGWEPGQFHAVFDVNKASINESALEADPVAVAIVEMVSATSTGIFEGSPSELYAKLNDFTPEDRRKSKYWPNGAGSMGSRMRRVAPLLRSAGFEVESRKSGTRTIRIVHVGGKTS